MSIIKRSGASFKPTPETKISDLLKAYPEMIEILARYNKHFELLRRPALRRLVTPLVTIEKAARTAQVDVNEMLAEIYRAIGEPLPPDIRKPNQPAQPEPAAMPEELRDLPAEKLVILDVREQVRAGEEPYHRIMKAVASLGPDQTLQLCNLFEPVPLYDVLAHRGFSHWTEQRGPEEWWITFFRSATPSNEKSPTPSSTADIRPSPDNPLVVDARGLEPPQPMMKILEALAGLAPGELLVELTDRPPRFLHAKLDDRGYRYTTEETKHGWCETRIWT
ncbi:MAG TPA: DUF2249 domain-containing protein [Candidatus Methylomirabilis sp.]|nr:DUF2249 domain-containing protein [Candidatus Methylomirabilis sp.]